MSTPACIAAVPRNGSERMPKLLVNWSLATGCTDGMAMAPRPRPAEASKLFQVWNSDLN